MIPEDMQRLQREGQQRLDQAGFTVGTDEFEVETVEHDGPGLLLHMQHSFAFQSFSPNSGMMAAQSGGSIRLFSPDFFTGNTKKPVARLDIPKEPSGFKFQLKDFQNHTYLLISRPSEVWVLDAETLKAPATGVPVYFDLHHPHNRRDETNHDPRSYPLTSTNDQNDPQVYFRTRHWSRSFDLSTGKVNFESSGSNSVSTDFGIPSRLTVEPDKDDEIQIRRKGAVAKLVVPPNRSWFVGRDLQKLYFLDRAELTPCQTDDTSAPTSGN